MAIKGAENMSMDQLRSEIQQGARLVVFPYVVSVLILTFRRGSDVHFFRPGESRFGAALPYALITMVAGWWGFPWGFIYTPIALIQNLGGGKDVTDEIQARLG